MSSARCPNCLEAAGEVIERQLTDGGLERVFECENCGHEWTVTF